jgi:dynein heavy chain
MLEAHKLLFSFCVAVKILQNRGDIDDAEWRFFISGTSGVRNDAPNPDPEWITAMLWGYTT